MPRFQLGRLPGFRSAARIERTIRSEIEENKSRLDYLGRDAAVLLQASLAIKSELGELTVGLPSRAEAAATATRLESVERAIREAADAIVNALETHDKQSFGRMVALRGELVAMNQPWDWSELTSSHDVAAEVALCAYLSPLLHAGTAIDVGAHHGLYAAALVNRGMEVLAVEPDAELARALADSLKETNAVVRQAAAGKADERVGAGIETLTVDRLRRDLGWSEEVGLVKLDARGAKLEVLAGFGTTRPEVVVVETRGADPVTYDTSRFRITPLLDAGKRMGFRRWIAFNHRYESVSFTVNPVDVPGDFSGSIVFIRDRDTFVAATDWCSRRVPRQDNAPDGPPADPGYDR